ncbi:MAG TPA: hypothetical protein VMY35_14110, partial [Phycisphaerae bacterium]|nr:hypothetical protein [Phycisphaerae bacterium]
MAIQFQCECGKTHSAEESMAGQAFTCNACGRALTVPSSAVARGASAFAEASADKMADKSPGAVGDLVSQMRGVQAERAAAPRDSAVQAAR